MSTDSSAELDERISGGEDTTFSIRQHPRLLLATTAVIVVGSVVVFFPLAAYVRNKELNPPPDPRPPTPDPAPVVVDPVPPEPDKANEEPAEEPIMSPGLLAVRKSKLGGLQSQLRQIRSKWDELDRVATKWHTDLKKQLAGDDGRKLAADPHLVERFMAVDMQERSSSEDIASIKRILDSFSEALDAVEAAIDDPAVEIPGDEFREEMDRVNKTDILPALQRYEEDVRMMEVLLRQAAGLQPSRDSLAEAIDAVEKAAEADRTERVTAAREVAEEEITRELEVLAKRQEEWQNQIELLDERKEADDLEAKAAKRKAQADHEKKMRKAAEELADLERRFESGYPKMKAYLAPFISEGYTQPTGRTYERSTTKGPVSYKSLLGAGVLGEDKDSVAQFYHSTVSGNNDRELGAFPPHSFSSGHFERHYETILKVQAFLREFGPVMAQEERGILAP